MATRRYSISVGNTLKDIVEGVGAATVAGNVELTIDLAPATMLTAEGKKNVLLLIEWLEVYLEQGKWPPA